MMQRVASSPFWRPSERGSISKLGEASRAEAAEVQVRALREELAVLKRQHDVEAAASREAQAEGQASSNVRMPRR